MEFRTLRADEIDLRVGMVKDNFYTLLLYKDARCDMNILDETVGKENWQRQHKEVKGNLYCSVGINCTYLREGEYIDRWIWKEDCGVESNTDREKGEASDSFKRACVNWGIGRELYTSPFIAIYSDNPKEESKTRKFRVKEIEYNDKREISKLVIVDSKGVQVFPKVNIETPRVVETSSFRDVELKCVNCLKDVKQNVADYSISKYGKVLCYDCQKEGK